MKINKEEITEERLMKRKKERKIKRKKDSKGRKGINRKRK